MSEATHHRQQLGIPSDVRLGVAGRGWPFQNIVVDPDGRCTWDAILDQAACLRDRVNGLGPQECHPPHMNGYPI